MTMRLGPILGFRGCGNDVWRASVLVVADDAQAPALKWGRDAALAGANGADTTTQLFAHKKQKVWRHDFSVPQEATEITVHYEVGGAGAHAFSVPAKGEAPRIAYASCNGFSSLHAMKQVDVKNRLWSHMADRHALKPFHLLLMGGDQIYADEMWASKESLKGWLGRSRDRRISAKFSKQMQRDLEDFYFHQYVKKWSQDEPAAMFASIPSLMMWDDHDIFDGWGSYPEDLHKCDVYQGIFEIARRHFEVFQLRTVPGERVPATLENQPAFSFGHRVGDVAILAVDMRSERTEKQVVGKEAWAAIKKWMRGGQQGNDIQGSRHLLVLSSIPVVHKDFALLEKFLGTFPGQQSLEDDLKDHWMSTTHKQERLRLIHRLLNFSANTHCRVTILSGDVHVGAVGTIVSDREPGLPRNAQVINQLTSSGIVHPAPPGMALWYLESTSGNVESVDRDITTQMIEFPGTDKKYIGTRNYLTLEPDPEGVLWANWWVENVDAPFTKALHPVPLPKKPDPSGGRP